MRLNELCTMQINYMKYINYIKHVSSTSLNFSAIAKPIATSAHFEQEVLHYQLFQQRQRQIRRRSVMPQYLVPGSRYSKVDPEN